MTKRLLRFDASVIFINLVQSKDDALRFPKKKPKNICVQDQVIRRYTYVFTVYLVC